MFLVPQEQANYTGFLFPACSSDSEVAVVFLTKFSVDVLQRTKQIWLLIGPKPLRLIGIRNQVMRAFLQTHASTFLSLLGNRTGLPELQQSSKLSIKYRVKVHIPAREVASSYILV